MSRDIAAPTKEGRTQRWEVQGEEDEEQGKGGQEGARRNGDTEETQVGIDGEEGLHGVSSWLF